MIPQYEEFVKNFVMVFFNKKYRCFFVVMSIFVKILRKLPYIVRKSLHTFGQKLWKRNMIVV